MSWLWGRRGQRKERIAKHYHDWEHGLRLLFLRYVLPWHLPPWPRRRKTGPRLPKSITIPVAFPPKTLVSPTLEVEMQWAQWWGRSWIPPWTKLLKGPVVMSANSHALPRGRKILDHIITMQVWDFQESASEPKHPQLPKPLVGSRAPGRTGKSSKVMAGVRGPRVVHSRLLWGVVSHRVYSAAIFSETKFLPQVLLLPTCSKCRRPAVVRSSYWTKALSRRRKQTWEVEPRAGDCGRSGSFSPSQASPEGVGIPLHPGRNPRGRWHQREKLRSWQSFPSPPIPTNTLSHIHTHKHAQTHTHTRILKCMAGPAGQTRILVWTC